MSLPQAWLSAHSGARPVVYLGSLSIRTSLRSSVMGEQVSVGSWCTFIFQCYCGMIKSIFMQVLSACCNGIWKFLKVSNELIFPDYLLQILSCHAKFITTDLVVVTVTHLPVYVLAFSCQSIDNSTGHYFIWSLPLAQCRLTNFV